MSKLTYEQATIELYNDYLAKISLHKKYVIKYANKIVFEDYSEISELRIIPPDIIKGAYFIKDGSEYLIPEDDTDLKVYYLPQMNLKPYEIHINGRSYSLDDFEDRIAKNRAIIPIWDINENEVSIQIENIDSKKTEFSGKYFKIQNFSFVFPKQIYYGNEKQDELFVELKTNIETDNFEFYPSDDILNISYNDGVIAVDIPRIKVEIYGVDEDNGKYICIDSITDDAFIRVINNTEESFHLTVGDIDFKDCKLIGLGSIRDRLRNYSEDVADIILHTTEEEIEIKKIVINEIFAGNTYFELKNDELYWDGGINYIGRKSTCFKLVMLNGHNQYVFYPVIGRAKVDICFDNKIVDGEYSWKIYNTSGDRLLSEGRCFLGNIEKIRFLGKTIEINSVTEDLEGTSKQLPIKTVYVDRINYVETSYVPSEEGVYSIYSGRMYWISKFGEKRVFSSKYNTIIGKYKINPVKIIYINDRYLRIINDDDEGIYCFNNRYSKEPGYEITDVEPTLNAKNYKDILFYLYSVQGKTNINKDENVTTEIKDNTEKIDSQESLNTNILLSDIHINNTSSEKVEKRNEAEMRTINKCKDFVEKSQDYVIEADVSDRILVNAGPGTGKTWTLIEKIIYLVNNYVEPEIQVLCFSRAAVEVIRNRIKEAIEDGRADVEVNYVDIRTFDSFATQLLYWVRESDYDDISASFEIEKLNYDERIELFNKVVSNNPDLISQCDHLIVDEVQDLVSYRSNMVLTMIKAIRDNCGVTLFGDACQAIYDYQVDEDSFTSDYFYNYILSDQDFSHIQFSKNYRQTDSLAGLNNRYRKAILKNDISGCHQIMQVVCESLPDYDVYQISCFDEDSLDRLIEDGSVGVLTRSNAQALYIDQLFRKKNIPHVLKRSLDSNYFSSWIGYLFNTTDLKSFDFEDFYDVYKKKTDGLLSEEEISLIWEEMEGKIHGSTGRISNRDLLKIIKNYSRNKDFFLAEREGDITISTIHRSKGKEYDSVLLLDSLLEEDSPEIEEQRVNYVALTRARNEIFRVELKNMYFRLMDDRRCFSVGFKGKTIHYFEVGKAGDIDSRSFAVIPNVQKYIRKEKDKLINKEVYLSRIQYKDINGTMFLYEIRLKKDNKLLGMTTPTFTYKIAAAVRRIHNLPYHRKVVDYLYPRSFSKIYILDISSEIGVASGDEKDVIEHGEMIAWNTLLIGGCALAGYGDY